MINFFAEFSENVSDAVRKTVRTVGGGFQRGMVEKYAEKIQNDLRKATPKSSVKTLHGREQVGTGKHARDCWEIDYRYGAYGGITEVEIANTKASSVEADKFIIDFLEYGTPPHGPDTAKIMFWTEDGASIFAHHVRGIKPMGFVRRVQTETERKMPAFVREAFTRPLDRIWR